MPKETLATLPPQSLYSAAEIQRAFEQLSSTLLDKVGPTFIPAFREGKIWVGNSGDRDQQKALAWYLRKYPEFGKLIAYPFKRGGGAKYLGVEWAVYMYNPPQYE